MIVQEGIKNVEIEAKIQPQPNALRKSILQHNYRQLTSGNVKVFNVFIPKAYVFITHNNYEKNKYRSKYCIIPKWSK